MKVNICGIPHTVNYVKDTLGDNDNIGLIEYVKARITINEDATPEIKKETLCHEMVHGILHHIGRNDLASDENFVQSLGNAIAQGFDIKELPNG